MTFTIEDKRDKIRSQLKYEITHPSLWYDPSKKKADKPNSGLCDGDEKL